MEAIDNLICNHEEILSYESDPLEWWKVKSSSSYNLLHGSKFLVENFCNYICDCLCKNPPCLNTNFGLFFEVSNLKAL